MNELAMKIKAPKRRGEWVELRFMAAAAENDLHVTKPWGDSAQYDFILEHQARLLRIQVKSTQFKCEGSYPCAVRGSHWRYAEMPSISSRFSSYPKTFGTSFRRTLFVVRPALRCVRLGTTLNMLNISAPGRYSRGVHLIKCRSPIRISLRSTLLPNESDSLLGLSLRSLRFLRDLWG